MSDSKLEENDLGFPFSASELGKADPRSLGEMWGNKKVADPVPASPLMVEHKDKLCNACESLLHRSQWEGPPAVPEATLHLNEFATALLNTAGDTLAHITGRELYRGSRVATLVDVLRLFLMSEPVTEMWRQVEMRPGVIGRQDNKVTGDKAHWVDIIDPSKQPTPVEPGRQSNSDQSAVVGEVVSAAEAMYDESGDGNQLYESANPGDNRGAYEDATLPDESDAKPAE